MKLLLHYGSNPDIPGGYRNDPVDKRKMTVEVSTLEEASTAYRAWIERNGLGSGNTMKNSGTVTDDNGQTVARISYNGRIWPKELT